MVYGYARVSTRKQAVNGNSLEEQKTQLNGAGAENIVVDVYTGTKMDRPELDKLLKLLQKGDKLIVTKLDRLARTAVEGSRVINELKNSGVIIHILNMGVVDDTPMGKLMTTMLLAFAEFERDLIVERTEEKNIARAAGIRVDGRPFKYSSSQRAHAMELLNSHSYREVSRMTGISVSTLIRERRRTRNL